MQYRSLAEFVSAMNEPPQSSRGRPPPDPRPIACTGCMRHPTFRHGVPVNCGNQDCKAPPHPLAWLALLPADQYLTSNQLRRLREMRSL